MLCAEVPCDVGDRRWHAPPEALGDLVAEGLEREGLPPCRPVAVEVRRVAHAYPVYRRGFRDVVEVVDWWASGLPGLLTLGRQGLFVHDNTHHALAMAWAAADALDASGRVDPARWVEARASFCSHVVED
ncbi:MAG: hypothetical protein M5U14_18175 [Acidimicrobiia bacterium]|nr:hypothetical protein [Acidimicrobiia bacterium]